MSLRIAFLISGIVSTHAVTRAQLQTAPEWIHIDFPPALGICDYDNVDAYSWCVWIKHIPSHHHDSAEKRRVIRKYEHRTNVEVCNYWERYPIQQETAKKIIIDGEKHYVWRCPPIYPCTLNDFTFPVKLCMTETEGKHDHTDESRTTNTHCRVESMIEAELEHKHCPEYAWKRKEKVIKKKKNAPRVNSHLMRLPAGDEMEDADRFVWKYYPRQNLWRGKAKVICCKSTWNEHAKSYENAQCKFGCSKRSKDPYTEPHLEGIAAAHTDIKNEYEYSAHNEMSNGM